MDNFTFFKRFKLYKETVLYVLSLIEHNIEFPDDRNNSMSPMNQLLCCLRFYASSGHLNSVADFIRIDVGTASRIVAKISEELARLYPRFIKLPALEDIVQEKEKFYSMFRFPEIIGVVDGTHIKINYPDVVARWPGSAHDATIFANSRLRARFETGEFPDSILIGDSGYSLREYFMTPIENQATQGKQRYNESLIRTRNLIERLIGVWKRRFSVVAYGLRLKQEIVVAVLIATSVLHNIAREMNEPEPPSQEELDANQLNYSIDTGNVNVHYEYDNRLNVNMTQNELINDFSNLG